MKCKILQGDHRDMESWVNKWLEENPNINIKFASTDRVSIGHYPTLVYVTIFYENKEV